MKKIFRMANAEISKIFMRPSMFVLVFLLVGALVLSFVFFKPPEQTKKLSYDGVTTDQVYLSFENDYKKYEGELDQIKIDIDNYLDINNDVCNKFKKEFQSLKSYFYDTLSKVIMQTPNSDKLDDASKEKIIKAFSDFRDHIQAVRTFMAEKIDEKYTNLFITQSDFEMIANNLKLISSNIPTEEKLKTYNRKNLDAIYDNIGSYNLDKMNITVNGLEEIKVDSEKLTNLLDLYYYKNISKNGAELEHIGRLKELYDDVYAYYLEKGVTDDTPILNELNDKIAKFYDYLQICKALLSNNFELLRIGNKTDDEIVKYNGFSGVSIYSLKNTVTTYSYFYENNTFGYEYLTAFNFGTNSGTSTNAFDFSFYAMQILSKLIILFVIFFACGTITGEQNSGTLKMIATRPYTRNKIYSGKFLACFNVALILLSISLVASMAVGIAVYGFTTQKVLVVINASKVFVTSPIILMLINLLSILLDIIFYITLSILISMLIRQTTISTAITSLILIVSTVLQGIVKASWIRFIPSLNTGIYKFFTTSELGLLKYYVVPNLTMISSLLILCASILMFDLIGRALFAKRNIDK